MRGDCRDGGLGGRREAGRGRARGRSGGGAGSVERAGGAPTLWGHLAPGGGPWQAPDDKGASQEGTGILAAWTGRFSVVRVCCEVTLEHSFPREAASSRPGFPVVAWT